MSERELKAAVYRLREFAAGRDTFRPRDNPSLRDDIRLVCGALDPPQPARPVGKSHD